MSLRVASLWVAAGFALLWIWLAVATHRIRRDASQKGFFTAGWLTLLITTALLLVIMALVGVVRPSEDTDEELKRRQQIAQIVSFSVVGAGYLGLIIAMGRKLERRLEVESMRSTMRAALSDV